MLFLKILLGALLFAIIAIIVITFIFKKYYKISVVDYIHLRKLLQAKYYMATSEMNISDISFLLGYSEAGYFCKIFKKYEGQTPSAFHKNSQILTSQAG